MLQLPAHMIHQVDQWKTQADQHVQRVVNELREDLIDTDESALWFNAWCEWALTHPPRDLAAALASAMLRLAQEGQR